MYDLAKTRIRIKKVFHYPREDDKENEVGATFISMERLPGEALDWNSASSVEKTKIMEQLADVFLEVERHPYQRLGSPLVCYGNSTGIRVAGFAQPQLFAAGDAAPLGPFASASDSLKAIIDL